MLRGTGIILIMKEELLNKIISVAYSDAGIRDRIMVYFLSKKDPQVKAVLDEYRNTAAAVHMIKEEKYSAKVIIPENSEEESGSFLLDLYTVLFSKPVRTFAVSAAIIIIAVSSSLLRKPEPQRIYSRQELERADAQARKTLTMVSNILHKTKSTVIEEVLPEKVSKPINDGFSIVKDFIHEEKKNENIN